MYMFMVVVSIQLWSPLKKMAAPTFFNCQLWVPVSYSQDLKTGCLKLAVVKFWGVQIFKGVTIYNILIFQQ